MGIADININYGKASKTPSTVCLPYFSLLTGRIQREVARLENDLAVFELRFLWELVLLDVERVIFNVILRPFGEMNLEGNSALAGRRQVTRDDHEINDHDPIDPTYRLVRHDVSR